MGVYSCICEHLEQVAISEAYIGKTETLLEMEKQIGLIRQRALKKFTDINKSPEVLAFNRLMEKQFGMDCFSLYVDQSNTINAYTCVVALSFDIALKDNISKYVEGDRNTGYRWKKGNKLAIMACIYMGLLANENITDGEIVAILLHELGHNFADAIYDDIKFENIAYMKETMSLLIISSIISFGLLLPSNIIAYIQNTNAYKNRQGKKTRKNIFRGIISGIRATGDNINNFVNEFIARLGGGSAYKNYKLYMDSIGAKDYYKTKSLGRQNEVIADKFCGVYGYGPEQVSALVKMDKFESKAERAVKKVPLIGAMNNEDFNMEIIDITDYDVHPHNVQRAFEELKLLNRELERTDIDPKMKKAIMGQIKQINSILDDCEKVAEDASKSEKAKANYYAFVRGNCPDAVSEELEDKIADAMDAVLDKGGKK